MWHDILMQANFFKRVILTSFDIFSWKNIFKSAKLAKYDVELLYKCLYLNLTFHC